MGIQEDGPVLEDVDGFNKWEVLLNVIASIFDGSWGAAIQQAGGSGEAAAMADQIAGNFGPKIGRWDPEKSSRFIQEF